MQSDIKPVVQRSRSQSIKLPERTSLKRRALSIFNVTPPPMPEPVVVPTLSGVGPAASSGRGGASARQSLLPAAPQSLLLPPTRPEAPAVHPGSWVTMRHIVKLVRRLLSESQNILAGHLLDRLLREASFAPALDSLVTGSNDAISQFLLGFVSSERRDADKIFDSLESWVSQLFGQEQGSVEISSTPTSKLAPKSGEKRPALARPSLIASLGLRELEVPHTAGVVNRVDMPPVSPDSPSKQLDWWSQATLDRVEEDSMSLNDFRESESRRESLTSEVTTISTRPSFMAPVSERTSLAASLAPERPSLMASLAPQTSLTAALGLPPASPKGPPTMSRTPSEKSLTNETRLDDMLSMLAKQPLDPVESDGESDASMMEDDTPTPVSSNVKESEVKDGSAKRVSKTSREGSKACALDQSTTSSRRPSGATKEPEPAAREAVSEDFAQEIPGSCHNSQPFSRWDIKAGYDDRQAPVQNGSSLSGGQRSSGRCRRSDSWPSEKITRPREVFMRALRRTNSASQHEDMDGKSRISENSVLRSSSAPCHSTLDSTNAWATAVPRIQLTDLSQNGAPKATRFVLPEDNEQKKTAKEEFNSEQNGKSGLDSWNSSAWQGNAGSEADKREDGPASRDSSSHKRKSYSSGRKNGLGRRTKPGQRRAAVTGMLGGMIMKDNLEEDQAAYLSTATHKFIINPGSSQRMLWDTFALVIILFESVILPLGLAFEVYPPDWAMNISTVFFTPDIVLNFFTGFYHNGMLIMRQHIIVKRYLLGWFLIDFLSTVPWEAILASDRGQASFFLKFVKIGKLMRVLRLLRILKLKALLQRFEEMFTSYAVLFTLSVAKTVMCYVLFCHWTGCLWGWLGAYDGNEEPHDKEDCEPDGPCEKGIGIQDSPWRRRYALETSSPAAEYLVSVQFATGLLTGSDLQLMPGYWAERLFVTIMMIVSFLVCSMIISQIVVVMEKINQDNSEYLEDTRMIRDFMVSRGMPLKLQTKVKRYLEYQFKSRKVVHQNHEILKKLSPFLRIEIQDHMNKSILEHHPFFANMEESVFSEVCYLARAVLYAPGDVVMRKGQLTSLICFIVRGQLMIKDAREGFSVYIKAPQWTGDRGLWVTSERTHTVVCAMHTELLIIQQQDLVNLVKNFPAAEAYIKDYCQRVLDDDPTVCFCVYCRCSGHELDNCEELDYAIEDRESNRRRGRMTVKSTAVSTAVSLLGVKASLSPFNKLMTSVLPFGGKDANPETAEGRTSTTRGDAYIC